MTHPTTASAESALRWPPAWRPHAAKLMALTIEFPCSASSGRSSRVFTTHSTVMRLACIFHGKTHLPSFTSISNPISQTPWHHSRQALVACAQCDEHPFASRFQGRRRTLSTAVTSESPGTVVNGGLAWATTFYLKRLVPMRQKCRLGPFQRERACTFEQIHVNVR